MKGTVSATRFMAILGSICLHDDTPSNPIECPFCKTQNFVSIGWNVFRVEPGAQRV
jgi:hypothetical protein